MTAQISFLRLVAFLFIIFAAQVSLAREDSLPANDEYDAPRFDGGTKTATCYSKALLAAAKRNVKAKYKNRARSNGQCAQAVREDLNLSLIDPGIYGDAVNYYKRPLGVIGALHLMGFRNLISKYRTIAAAPAGSVLVFSGPRTSEYLDTGTYPAAKDRKGREPGDWVGHITVKGDDKWFYTDGRTATAANPGRTLVGVFMLYSCRECVFALRRKCGDAM